MKQFTGAIVVAHIHNATLAAQSSSRQFLPATLHTRWTKQINPDDFLPSFKQQTSPEEHNQ